MIVTNLEDLNDTERDVRAETWRSRRIVLAREGVGFSMHDTVIYAGTTSTFHYENHIEAVYCVQGEGTLTNEETREGTEPPAATLYLLTATTNTPRARRRTNARLAYSPHRSSVGKTTANRVFTRS